MKMTFDMVGGAGASEPAERSCYRRSRGGDPIATIASLALVGLIGGAFATMSPMFVKRQASTPTIMTLTSLPDDPPPAETPTPPQDSPPPQAQLIAPAQIVQTPPPPLAVLTAPVTSPVPEPAPPRAAPPAEPAPRGPENQGELSARMISAKPPRYPMDSRRQREEGTVVLSVLLSTDGRVQDVSISRSSGFQRLDRAALDAVRDWRWSPLMRNGVPVMVRGSVTIPFVLRGSRGDRDRLGPSRGGQGPDNGPGRDEDGAFDRT